MRTDVSLSLTNNPQFAAIASILPPGLREKRILPAYESDLTAAFRLDFQPRKSVHPE
jgi:hypothetical protein